MKLKRKILCPLFLISLFLPSCSSIGTTSSIQNIGQTSTPVESSDTSSSSFSSSSSYPYVTETLREGFHVQPGIPDRNGTIDTTALSGLLDTIEDRLDLGSVFSKYRSNLSEATPLLRQGGWTTQTIKEIRDVLSSESLFHAAHSGKGFRDAVELSESEIHAIYGKAIQDIIHLLDDDQLSSLLFAMTRVGILSQSNIVLSFSLLESVSLSMIESIASSKEVQSDFMANQYWQGMLSSTPLSSTFLTFLQSDEFNEISWYIFRIVANVVREIAEKIPVEDVIAFIQNMRELSSGPEELTPEMLAAIFPMFGRIFDECFCDRQSFATLAEMMRDALIEAKGSASTLDFVSNAGSDNIVTVSQEGEDTDGILEILKKSDDLFNVLKFAALLVRNMTTEDFRSLIEIDRLDDSDEEVTMQNGRLIVLFSKMYVTNMTRFGADSNQVISSIEDLIPDFLSVVMGTKISLSEVRDESNVYLAEFRSDSVNINSRLAEDVVNLIESSAQHELESLSLADCEEIVGEFTSIGERFGLDDWNSYRYRIEIRHQYQVGEAPVVNVWSDQESIEPILSDLEGFSSVQPHVGMASVSFYQYSVSFSYSVYNEVSPELVQDIYFARTTKTENYFEQHSTLPDVRVQIDGELITVPRPEILNYSSTTPGQYYATFPIGEEKKDYLGFTYYIYSEKDYQKTIEITTPLYEGQWIGKRTGFQSVNTTSITVNGKTKEFVEEEYYTYQNQGLVLDASTAGRKEYYWDESQATVRYEVLECESIEYVCEFNPSYTTGFFGMPFFFPGMRNDFAWDMFSYYPYGDVVETIRLKDGTVISGACSLDAVEEEEQERYPLSFFGLEPEDFDVVGEHRTPFDGLTATIEDVSGRQMQIPFEICYTVLPGYYEQSGSGSGELKLYVDEAGNLLRYLISFDIDMHVEVEYYDASIGMAYMNKSDSNLSIENEDDISFGTFDQIYVYDYPAIRALGSSSGTYDFRLNAEGYLCSQIPMHYEILLQE